MAFVLLVVLIGIVGELLKPPTYPLREGTCPACGVKLTIQRVDKRYAHQTHYYPTCDWFVLHAKLKNWKILDYGSRRSDP